MTLGRDSKGKYKVKFHTEQANEILTASLEKTEKTTTKELVP